MAKLTVTSSDLSGSSVEYDSFRYAMLFYGVTEYSVRFSSPTTLVLGTAEADRLVITGTDLVFDPNQPNPWLAGTITGIQLWSRAYDHKIADITDITIALSDFGSTLTGSTYSASSFLFDRNDSMIGGAGADALTGYNGNDTLLGGSGSDDLTPGAGEDLIDGGDGFDWVEYWDFVVIGGDATTTGVTVDLRLPLVLDPWGNFDRLVSIEGAVGTDYADTLIGNSLSNELYGELGNDRLDGLEGDDFLVPGKGADTINGGAGWDTISYADYAGTGALNINLATGQITDPWGNVDVVSGIEAVRGSGNADTITGTLFDETFYGLGGDDTINGGGGSDWVNYAADKSRGGLSGVQVNLQAGTARDGFGTSDTLLGIVNATGTDFDDIISGTVARNVLVGRDGRDQLNGLGGDDLLYGGAGIDTLTGGSGFDGFVFDTKLSANDYDVIIDFNPLDDTIWLDNAIFTRAGREGRLASGAFWKSTSGKAHDASDRIIYDTDGGALYYDSNGTGKGGVVKIAQLDPKLKLTYQDFYIY